MSLTLVMGLFCMFKFITRFLKLIDTGIAINLKADEDGYVNMKMLVALLKEFHYDGAKEFHEIK